MFIIDVHNCQITGSGKTLKAFSWLVEKLRQVDNDAFLKDNYELIYRCAQRGDLFYEAIEATQYDIIETLLEERLERMKQRIQEYKDLGFL